MFRYRFTFANSCSPLSDKRFNTRVEAFVAGMNHYLEVRDNLEPVWSVVVRKEEPNNA